MRKTVLFAVLMLAGFATLASGQTFVSAMTGASEAPGPGDPDGFGLAGLRFEGTSVFYSMLVQNIGAPTVSHIHRGAPGVPGPVVVTLALSFPNNTAVGVASASAAVIQEIRANPGNFYVNVHNGQFPDGAIRGQLSFGSFATLTGAEEAPGPGDADGNGLAIFTLTAGNVLNFASIVQGIDAPNASHIHRGAPGVPGPIVVTTSSSFPDNRAVGTVAISQALLDEIAGNPSNFYFNVHNAAFPDGAIRGQLRLAGYSDTFDFPVVGRVDGLNNTRFVSDVRIVNTSAAPVAVTLEFFPSSAAGLSGASATRALTIAPGEEAVINDVVGTLFATTGLGALRIGASGSGLTTGVRVFNDLRAVDGGTTGFFVPSKGVAAAKTSGVLPFLSNASPADTQARLGFRTNIGWFNPSLTPAGATFRAHRASDGAVLGSVDVGIAGLSQLQQGIFQLISTVAEADRTQTDFYVTWTSTVPIHVYAAVVDNRTGDVVYVD